MSVKFKQWGQNIPEFLKCAAACRSSKHRQAQQLVLWAVNGTVWNPTQPGYTYLGGKAINLISR